jgi:hypothetical protein
MLAFTAPPVQSRPKDWSAKNCSCSPYRRLYGRRTVRSLQVKPDPVPIIGMQHSLSLYAAFAGGVR